MTLERTYTPFQFANYKRPYQATAQNNGHSVEVRFRPTDQMMPTVKGGGLPDEYTLDHLHFHWESEHTVNNYRFPMEMHLVHYATKHGNLSTAQGYPGGIAVLGVLFDLSPDDDQDFTPLVQMVGNIQHDPGHVQTLSQPIEADSFLPRDKAGYYRYFGSLTTPTCNEVVIWTIFTNTLRISESQRSYFESVWSETGPLVINYRQIQNLNGRMLTVRTSPIRSTGYQLKINLFYVFLAIFLSIFIRINSYH